MYKVEKAISHYQHSVLGKHFHTWFEQCMECIGHKIVIANRCFRRRMTVKYFTALRRYTRLIKLQNDMEKGISSFENVLASFEQWTDFTKQQRVSRETEQHIMAMKHHNNTVCRYILEKWRKYVHIVKLLKIMIRH